MMIPHAVCQICTDVYDMEKPVAAMPCGHTFHDDCLERWLQNTRNCPTCRKPLKKTQHPIHRLFFSIDHNSSQLSGSSPKNKDPVLLEKNRKLQAQVTALQAAITKLKSECQQGQDESTALSCALSDKNAEIQSMGRVQDKLKRKLRDFTGKQDELEEVRSQLHHLRHVQTIVEGVEAEVKHMLEEKAGYTSQQLTYVVLLRQQLDNSKRNNEKLRRDLSDCKEKLISSQRKSSNAENEIEMLKLELKQAEVHNVNLRKKCDMLIKSINSPRGISSSLANRIIHQSPAPDFLTPPVPEPSRQARGKNLNINHSTPAARYHPTNDEFDGSTDLFNDSDVVADNVKQTLDFLEEDQPQSKKTRLITSRDMLTQDRRDVGDESPAAQSFTAPIKPKSTIRLKGKSKLRPINPVGQPAGVKDVTNIPIGIPSGSERTSVTSRPSNFFRQGFDGMGGQVQSFSRTKQAMQFNVFKKPAVVKKSHVAPLTTRAIFDEPIVID